LQENGLLVTKYRKVDFNDIFDDPMDLDASSTHANNMWQRFKYGVYCCPVVGACAYKASHIETFIAAGEVGLFLDNNNNYLFAKPGLHNINSFFVKKVGKNVSVQSTVVHGPRTIVTIEQGKVSEVASPPDVWNFLLR